MTETITIIGGGLAGCEVALKLARAGHPVRLVDMKPSRLSPAHKSPLLGELVCSNSLRAEGPTSAVGLLKAEMAILGSAVMEAAHATRVPAGRALAVNRELFAAHLDGAVGGHPLVRRENALVETPPAEGPAVIATGPLTEGPLAQAIASLAGAGHLHFYDAIAPIVAADSVDMERAFWADRYGEGEGDYLNCPMTTEEYRAFYQALMEGEQAPLRDFEKPQFFEGCLPIEVMAARGEKTLTFGPLKPVGLNDPVTGKRYHAVVQLRKEDADGRYLNLVGFQTKLTHPAQDRVFRLIPALARAEFARLGSIHRNTFVDAPRVLNPDLSLKAAPHLILAGQLAGVEGYVESAACGILAGLSVLARLSGRPFVPPPPTTAHGGLLTHLGNAAAKHFQPSNITFGLLPPLGGKKLPKKERGRGHAEQALADLAAWMKEQGMAPAALPPILE